MTQAACLVLLGQKKNTTKNIHSNYEAIGQICLNIFKLLLVCLTHLLQHLFSSVHECTMAQVNSS